MPRSPVLAILPLAACTWIVAEDAPAPMIGDVISVDEDIWVEAASRRRQRITTAPQPVIVLTKEDLVSTPAIALGDRMRYVSGIDVQQTRHGQHDIGMRGYNGLGNSRILVLADDLDMRWEGLGATLWNGTFGPTELDRVEIAKGPGSVASGANAFGGTVLLRTRRAGEDHEAVVQGAYGDPRRAEADATVLGPLGSFFDYKLNAGAMRLDDLDGAQGANPHQPHPRTANSGDIDTEVARVGGEIGWKPVEGLRLAAGYRYADFNEWEIVDDFDVGSNHTDWIFHTGTLVADLGDTRLLYARQWADYFYSTQKDQYGPLPGLPDFRYAQAGFEDVRDTLRATTGFDLADHHLTVGGELISYRSRSNLWGVGGSAGDDRTWAEVDTDNQAVFAEDQWAFLPSWILTGGLRIDDNSRVGTNASPRLALNWSDGADAAALVSFSRGYRNPNLIESNIQEYYFASDPDLDAETISAVEVEWSQRSVHSGATWSVNGFYNRSEDLIWALPLPSATMQANYNAWLGASPPASIDFTQQPGPFFQFANVDSPVHVLGAELAGRHPFDLWPIALWGNATWQHFRYQDPVVYRSPGFFDAAGVFTGGGPGQVFVMDTTLPEDVNAPPELKANLGCDLTWRRCFAQAVLRYVGERTVFSFAASNFSAGQLAVQEVDDYLALDLGLGWDFSTRQDRSAYVRLSVMDCFDTGHVEWYETTSARLTADHEHQLTSEIGRMVTFEGRWTF